MPKVGNGGKGSFGGLCGGILVGHGFGRHYLGVSGTTRGAAFLRPGLKGKKGQEAVALVRHLSAACFCRSLLGFISLRRRYFRKAGRDAAAFRPRGEGRRYKIRIGGSSRLRVRQMGDLARPRL